MILSAPLSEAKARPCLRSEPATSIFVATVSRVFHTVLIFDDDILIADKSVWAVRCHKLSARSLKGSCVTQRNVGAMHRVYIHQTHCKTIGDLHGQRIISMTYLLELANESLISKSSNCAES